MEGETSSIKWTSQLFVTPPTRTPRLYGDKILLPPAALEQLLAAAPITAVQQSNSHAYTRDFDPFNPYSYAAERQAREQFLDRQQQLPQPLTFRIVNPQNARVVYAGIREFSSNDDEVGLSSFLREALGFEDGDFKESPHKLESTQEAGVDVDMIDASNGHSTPKQGPPKVTVHAKQLPKGTYVRLRPLEAGYDPEDWKSLLERYLRDNFTTLTNGELLTVPGGKNEHFRFLVDKFVPEGDGICIVDTDLEVDIEALNEEQARETLKKKLAKSQRVPGTKDGSSSGGQLTVGEEVQGQVIEGEYVDYEIREWDRSRGLEIEMDVTDEDVDIFVSPFSSKQRARPRDDEHVFGDFASTSSKRIILRSTNVELEDAEAIYISIHASPEPPDRNHPASENTQPIHYSLRASPPPKTKPDDSAQSNPDEVQCKNCHQMIPKQTLFLHENFCFRNNILCPHCSQVFQKRSPEWQNHWHCPHDTDHGNAPASKRKHDIIFHTSYSCPNCDYSGEGLPALAHHRTTTCPGKLILCQFCHLLVPQQGEGDPDLNSSEVIFSGLTPHELAEGARTTECHLCAKIVRLRDMKTHLRHHDVERLSRPKPSVCRNVNCGRTAHKSSTLAGKDNDQDLLGLCSACFGPLFVAMYDPDHKALKRRVERRYLTQLLSGCGKTWCQNDTCKTGRSNMGMPVAGATAKDALPMIKPLVDASIDPGADGVDMRFCVDEASQKRRGLAEMMAKEGDERSGYDLEWCVAALESEAGDLGRAREWLKGRAPERGETAVR